MTRIRGEVSAYLKNAQVDDGKLYRPVLVNSATYEALLHIW